MTTLDDTREPVTDEQAPYFWDLGQLARIVVLAEGEHTASLRKRPPAGLDVPDRKAVRALAGALRAFQEALAEHGGARRGPQHCGAAIGRDWERFLLFCQHPRWMHVAGVCVACQASPDNFERHPHEYLPAVPCPRRDCHEDAEGRDPPDREDWNPTGLHPVFCAECLDSGSRPAPGGAP